MRMKGVFVAFFLIYIVPNVFDWTMVQAAKSLLTKQQYPTVFADLSFADRMEILAEDYESLGTEFDENGVCVRGCAYQGITIEEDLERMERQTEAALAQLKKEGYMSEDGKLIQQQNQPAQAAQTMQYVLVQPNMPYANVSGTAPATTPGTTSAPAVTNTTTTSSPPSGQVAASCATRKSDIPVGQKKPLGEPLDGKARISSKFGPRINPKTKKPQNHNGVDLAVPKGKNIYSPADGHVKSAFTDSTCGKGVKITHADGYETVYCHMSEHTVKTGDSVVAGCLIGKVGSTGRSTGPHLHYSVRLNGTAINPVKLMGR